MPSKRKFSDARTNPSPKRLRQIDQTRAFNERPTEKLNVYVFGDGEAGELGLGTGPETLEIEKPVLNRNLCSSAVGVVHVAAGGMHAVALTHDNRILTWGANDDGALGRDTKQTNDDSESNPRESTPTDIAIQDFAPGAVFTQVAAGDSTSFALTDDGKVWGWGTFRVSLEWFPLLYCGMLTITIG